MTWRSVTVAILAACLLGPADCPGAEDKPAEKAATSEAGGASLEYVPLDAPAGMSQAVIVEGHPLVHTRQLVPLDQAGKMVGDGSVDKQVEQVLDNLEAVLDASGSSLEQLVRLNVYALEPSTVDRVREELQGRLEPAVRPTITAVLTPMQHRDALVAVDAVAVATEKVDKVTLKRCKAVAGDKDCADAAILPRGGVAYLSGLPAAGSVATSPVAESIGALWNTLGHLKLSPADVVQLKVFLRPAASADEVRRRLKEFFPDQMIPPVVFVEWLATPPVEIEMIAMLPLTGEAAPNVEHYDPPEVSPSNMFCRVGLVRTERQIYTSGLFARKPGHGQHQAQDVFDQLEAILAETKSDLRHMAKATYYVSEASSESGIDRVRLWRYDQDRAPAASKCMVHGVGQAERSMTLDMIAVEVDK